MEPVYLLLGGNQGDRTAQLQAAIAMIDDQAGTVVVRSACYETEPWGYQSEARFLNQVVQLETNLKPALLLETLLGIELELGRKRVGDGMYQDRPIDIDILAIGDQVITTERLTVPHPELANRRFALAPLVQVAPGWIHPILQLSSTELLARCTDELKVEMLDHAI